MDNNNLNEVVSSLSNPSFVALLNSSNVQIDPATEAKQEDAITQLTLAVSRLTDILTTQTDGTQKNKIVGTTGEIAEVNANGQLHTVLRGTEDYGNSTTTPLTAGSTFTGVSIDTLDYATISIVVHSDQASATDGLKVEYSSDGVDWHDGEMYTILAGATKFFTPTLQARYMMISYTNGAVNQADFHLHTVLRKTPIKWSSHNINDPVMGEDDAELIKAVLTGELPGGLYDNVSITVNADGQNHLNSAMIQKIISSANNTTTTNLASGATFTGIAEETFGVNGIQVYHFADQDCTIYIDQSLDATNWDIVDNFACLANESCTRSFQSVAPYFRARVENTGPSTTTEIRFSVGMTPMINPLPRALTEDNRLRTESTLTGQQNTERHVWVSPTNALIVDSPVRLVGTNYDGQTKDPNFWTEATTGSGTVTQDGEIQLDTGVTANSTASYTSVRKARFVVGSALKFQGLYKFVTAGTTDNIRRMGAYLATDGFFFQLDGTTFSIGHRKNSSDTLVNSGSFNGNMGPNFTPLTTQYYKFEIEWSPKGTFWYIDGVLLHKIGTGHLSDILTLPIAYENINDNGSIVDVAFDCLGVAIVRLGDLITNATYKYISGAATTVLKYGAGDLHSIVNNDNSGSLIAYDNTAGSGQIICSVDLVKVLGDLNFNAPFSNGLTIVTTGSAKITVTYE